MKKFLCMVLIPVLVIVSVVVLADSGILGEGSRGAEVLRLEKRLFELGYNPGQVDEVFDADTAAALRQFQTDRGLAVTGQLDADTKAALYETGFGWGVEADFCYEEAAYGAMPMVAATSMPALGKKAYGNAAWDTSEYTHFRENGFHATSTDPLSTFAADVDTASYAKVRRMILAGDKVPADAVRVEEMLNYFHYDYAAPAAGEPLGVTTELVRCPWNDETLLLLVGLRAEDVAVEDRKPQNLIFLIDVSGSMYGEDRLDLVKRAFLLLLDQLQPGDTISIVTYASRDEVVLEGCPATDRTRIMEAITGLDAGGATNGSAGILTAYELAEKYFVPGGVNRILLATDGDLNLGTTSQGELIELVSEKRKSGVSLTVLGFGMGNYKDNKLEALADNGNGSCHYIDTIYEARKALVEEAGGTFVTVASDVKLQVDFNPAMVRGWRLIGYEDRLLASEDFADDTVDGGEIGSGHMVTVLYELVPADSTFDFGGTVSRYAAAAPSDSDEWLTLSIRAKKPGEDKSSLYTYPLSGPVSGEMSDNMRFAAAVAETGMLLRGSEWKGTATYASALALLRGCGSVSGDQYREEFLYLVTLLAREDGAI